MGSMNDSNAADTVRSRCQYESQQSLLCGRSLLKSGQQKDDRHQPASVPLAFARNPTVRLHSRVFYQIRLFPSSNGHNQLLTS